MMYGPAKKLSRVNADLQQAMAAAERIFEMLDTHSEVAGARRTRRRCRRSRGAIEFRDVHFAYGGADAATLRGVSFTVGGRPDAGDRRPQRRRQDDARQPDPAVLRRDRRRDR